MAAATCSGSVKMPETVPSFSVLRIRTSRGAPSRAISAHARWMYFGLNFVGHSSFGRVLSRMLISHPPETSRSRRGGSGSSIFSLNHNISVAPAGTARELGTPIVVPDSHERHLPGLRPPHRSHELRVVRLIERVVVSDVQRRRLLTARDLHRGSGCRWT